MFKHSIPENHYICTYLDGLNMSKKKKNKLPMDRYSSYGAVILGILTIVFIAVTWNSTSRYTGEATGTVTDIFHVMPDRAGNWVRRCEVAYTADGKEYKLRTDCPGLTSIGDTCKVSYHPKRPKNAFAEW